MNITVLPLSIKSDTRGRVVEMFRQEIVGGKRFGQVLFVSALPGQTRGNHFHKRKTEWYCVIYGKALLGIENNKTKEKKEIAVDGEHMMLVKIPPNYTHWIKNTGDSEMFLTVYVDETFNPLDPDTYYSNKIK